ncbi:hypothetical protein B0A52_04771 [Exophiala mesophila]|uniref:Uncharacterized protein n=1 Tax=Exophiala mesophila TaxID=212818 RepID=A0A438N624_EXOME|nr:hypothetical protein B0A52_04771 [Exophiala mesophila]
MGICVWSALHLNIAATNETTVQYWLRTVRWILLGVFGPELVVFAAWRQYISARAMQNLQNGPFEERPEHGSPACLQNGHEDGLDEDHRGRERSKHPMRVQTDVEHGSEWTVVHGFYAAMGGFVFELDSETATTLHLSTGAPHRITITPCGIMMLAQCGVLPRIRKEDIKDKSKADGLAKLVVCLQAGWMVVQTLARVAYQLPVSLLEVNTIGHVVCATFIYILWWHKPRLIREPTPLRGPWVRALATFMWMHSRLSECAPSGHQSTFKSRDASEISKLAFVQDHSDLSTPASSTSEIASKTVRQNASLPCQAYRVHRPGIGCLGLRHDDDRIMDCSGCAQAPRTIHGGFETGMVRWNWAMDAVETFPQLRHRLKTTTQNGQMFKTEALLQERAVNWPSRGQLTAFRGVVMGMILWLASIAYGAVHTAAWNDYFPTEVEAWLWRASSIDIMASGLVWLTINFLAQVSTGFDRYWDKVMEGRASRIKRAFPWHHEKKALSDFHEDKLQASVEPGLNSDDWSSFAFGDFSLLKPT